MLSMRKGLDTDELHQQFVATGGVSIPNFLAKKDVAALQKALDNESEWQLVLNQGQKHFDVSQSQLAVLGPEKRQQLYIGAYQNACDGFSYLYENMPIADMRARGIAFNPVFEQLLDLLNGAPFLERARTVLGDASASFTDAQLTKYGPGHYLTQHDDFVEGKNRLCAYILSMNKDWKPEWGGLLHLVDDDGEVCDTFSPAWNTLRLIRVPQMHFVSAVAPYAPRSRFSVTGWVRSGAYSL